MTNGHANTVWCRCRVIPCVSRELGQIHEDYPPKRSRWKTSITPSKPITKPMLKFFQAITASLEQLDISVWCKKTGLLSQMLAVASITAPNLHQLLVVGYWGSISRRVFDSIALFGQIKRLSVSPWRFPEDGDVTQMQRLSGLRSLEVGLPLAMCVQLSAFMCGLHVNPSTCKSSPILKMIGNKGITMFQKYVSLQCQLF